ncbi:MAG: patatin-like phospholipase family protein [Williamsia sp.]|nr:patatin-like phospholipase family protein [Williamsia sp.]
MSKWGPLEERYTTRRSRKILALDGGGIRGVITLQFLAELETKLKEKLGRGDDFRLSDFYDYFGGTSTGAIIAAGLSIGMRVQELLDFYTSKGKDMFDKNFLFKQWKALYESGPLLEMLKQTFGGETDMDMANGKFRSLLTVVTMNRSTDSPWPISNNPDAHYNDPARPDRNSKIKLFQLVRASTAAPVYFPPETLQWDPDDPSKTFVFVDGGVTPYNNPAFLLYRMATQPAYNLNWETGEDKLLITSVGTGAAPSTGEYHNLVGSLKGLPSNLMYAMQVDQDINCRTVGRCSFGAPIDKELHDMIPMDKDGHLLPFSQPTDRHFLYMRYNADLSQEGLNKLELYNISADHVSEMDSVKYIGELQEVGKAAAARQVSLDHFGSFV